MTLHPLKYRYIFTIHIPRFIKFGQLEQQKSKKYHLNAFNSSPENPITIICDLTIQ